GMALTLSEGSIGGDIERVSVHDLQAFYENGPAPAAGSGEGDTGPEPTGSNGIAIAPANTINHHALLLINPHTSFFFRAEVHVVSNQGLDAYGAVTWGQFFVYQGFNDHAGWMHTSSGVDAIDEYLESVVKKGDRYYYRYGAEDRPVTVSTVTVPYVTATGMARKTFTVYRTHHGPVVRRVGEQWVTIRLMQEPVKALIQSYTRTKARDYRAFRRVMELHTNSSNNTIFADADGDIAYFHGNFIPRRDTSFDWTKPVDGSNPATEPLKAKLSEQIALLRAWDLRWSATSVPTSLAVCWGDNVERQVGAAARRAGVAVSDYIAQRATAAQLLQALAAASDTLTAD